MKQKNYLFYFLIIFTISCSKEEEIAIINKYRIDGNVYDVTPFRIYTKNGEVFDQKLIDKHIKSGFFTTPENIDFYKDLTAVEYSNSTVKTTYSNNTPFERTQDRDVLSQNETIVWKNKERIGGMFFRYSMFEFQKYDFVKILDKNEPQYDELAREEYNDSFFIQNINNELMLPMVQAISIKYITPYYTNNYGYHENNIFKQSYISEMGENDTIIVQEYKLKLIKNK